MNETAKKTNFFVRTLIVFFCFGLSFMIGFNFFAVEPVGVIKEGVFILLAILLVLVLAESFDNFSIGKLVSIKREVEVKKEENKKLEQKNNELISHILTITNTQTQKQLTTTVLGDYYTESRKDIQHEKTNNDSVQELIDRIGNSIVIMDLEASIKEELTGKGLVIEGDTDKVLIRHLAGTQLLLAFERIHSYIFGTQLFLLRQLNKSIPYGLTENDVLLHFENIKKRFGDTFLDWNCEKYLTYLYSKALIIRTEETGNIHITNLGVEYLTWITRAGIDDDKAL